jgi:hypothetical protein
MFITNKKNCKFWSLSTIYYINFHGYNEVKIVINEFYCTFFRIVIVNDVILVDLVVMVMSLFMVTKSEQKSLRS